MKLSSNWITNEFHDLFAKTFTLSRPLPNNPLLVSRFIHKDINPISSTAQQSSPLPQCLCSTVVCCLNTGKAERKKVSFLHQRSYSCGDLSPSETEKEEEEEDSDETEVKSQSESKGTQQSNWHRDACLGPPPLHFALSADRRFLAFA